MDSSPDLDYPSTPSRSRTQHSSNFSHQPMNSSPLASPKSSPVAAAQARRRSLYKSRTPSGRSLRKLDFSGARSLDGTVFGRGETSQATLLRERFKARCFDRANKARDRAVKGKRCSGSDGSSDVLDGAMDCEDDEEEDDDTVMQDELFRRIMENANRKARHQYRLSYAHEVGSSVDPDMEDVGRWEHELCEFNLEQASSPPELTADDLEAEELAAYAEEYTAFADFEDLDEHPDELVSDAEGWSVNMSDSFHKGM